MKIQIPKKVKFVIDEIYNQGYEAFIVGGCVRDSILGLKPNDYDITTNAKPNDIKRIFSKYKLLENGIKHGTVGVIIDKEVYEITTYRLESDYEKNRRPKNVEFTSNIVEDLKRRDFTINSMAYNDKVGLVDEFKGIEDIKKGIIKTVGEPDKRFNEDGLRIIRAIRFSSKLGFKIEDETLDSIYKNAKIIKNISKERITEEFNKTILSKNPEKIILLYKTKILETIGVYNYINKDINELENNLALLKKCDLSIEERLSMLEYILSFNEINNIEINGKINPSEYYKEIIKPNSIVNKLILSKKISEYSNALIEYMIIDMENYDNSIKIKSILNKVGPEILKKSLILKKMYNKYCLRGKMNNRQINQANIIIDKCYNEIIRIEENGECYQIKDMNISGNDLKEFGYRGIEIGEKLNLLLEEIIKDPKLNTREKLLSLL